MQRVIRLKPLEKRLIPKAIRRLRLELKPMLKELAQRPPAKILMQREKALRLSTVSLTQKDMAHTPIR